MPPPLPCAPVAGSRHALPPWHLRPVVMNNRDCLVMQWDGDEDTRAISENMVLQLGQEPLKVSVVDKQVHVCGNFVKGSADTITRNTADGSLVLEGHVKMHYGKEGKKVEVAAEHVVVGIADGRIEVSGLERAARPPLTSPKAKEVRPTSTAPTSCPACPRAAGDCNDIFSFWTGFFR
jgi:hypothetical protein